MKIISKQVESNVESIKEKNSEKDFYKYLEDKLPGIGITKIVPFQGIYIDLMYLDENKIGLYKFMDTTEDTFSIFSDEILEIMEEEYNQVKKQLNQDIPYYFVMPYVNLEKKNLSKSFIIDNHKFEEIINDEVSFTNFISEELEQNISKIVFELAKEYFIIKREIEELEKGEFSLEGIEFRSKTLMGTLMEDTQVESVNNFKYGSTLLLGSTGTGKTSIMLSKSIKIARLYPKENFLYITFDKQLGGELTKHIKNFFPDITNLKIINFHQFVLLLGKKYSLRLNNKSKQSFNKEFYKVFAKVAKIYQGKRYYKGIFVDEAENFTKEEIEFLRNISFQTKNFLCVSYDRAKRLSEIENVSSYDYEYDNILTLDNNFRNSKAISMFNMEFQNKLEEFSALEIGEIGDYFIPYGLGNQEKGEVNLFEGVSSKEIMDQIVNKIKELESEGYKTSEMCIIYPFNIKVLKGQKHIYSKHLVKTHLEENEILYSIADDETSNRYQAQGVTLTNIYNVNNLEYKIIFFCQLEVLFAGLNIENKEEAQKITNILYTAMGRATEKLFIYLKEDDNRPGILDLLKLTAREELWNI